MTLISHLEHSLGEIDQGWKAKDGAGLVQVVRFTNQPFNGVMTYVTLGLSNTLLPMSQGREIRQELIFSAYDKFSAEEIVSFMLSFCDYILAQNKALLRGDIVGPSDPLIPNVAVDSVYASIPAIFDERLSTYRGSSPNTVMVWLIPLRKDETNFVRTNGWSQFEDILERENPDLMELNRMSTI